MGCSGILRGYYVRMKESFLGEWNHANICFTLLSSNNEKYQEQVHFVLSNTCFLLDEIYVKFIILCEINF